MDNVGGLLCWPKKSLKTLMLRQAKTKTRVFWGEGFARRSVEGWWLGRNAGSEQREASRRELAKGSLELEMRLRGLAEGDE